MPDGSFGGAAAPADNAQGKDIIERLRAGKLPQMVDWFDPGLLAQVGVRAIISATLGQYNDQRLMQAATDQATWEELARRYDYSGIVALDGGTLVQTIAPSTLGRSSLASTEITVSVDQPSGDLGVTLGGAAGTIPAGSGRRSVTLTTVANDTGPLELRIKSATGGSVSFARVKAEIGPNATGWQVQSPAGELRLAYPPDQIPLNEDGSVWIDYIADLGDGFEATYAMAYLLASEELKVEGEATPLPAGKLLVMGGDQVYPDATKQEYNNRLRDPYDWAWKTDRPTRKLFAIPGNHDWYDGLAAFGAVFCSARDRITGGIGAQIGGWRCHQHRSYFAIRLPHNWWIWGPDIQLADNLDDSQRDYFDLMAEQTRPGDNILLCLAEPSWLHKNYDNMHEISMIARKNGAKICAVIAGDLHHYSRYWNEELGTQFITAGGGGAFAHATHKLKPNIDLKWATLTGGVRTSSKADGDAFNRIEREVIRPGGPDFTQQRVPVSAGGHPASPRPAEPRSAEPAPPPSAPGSSGHRPHHPIEEAVERGLKAVRKRKEDIKSAIYDCRACAHIYPPQSTSRWLSMRNLALPFHNRGFTVLVGIVYFLYAWVWSSADPRQSPIIAKMAGDLQAQAVAAQNAAQQASKDLEQAEKRHREAEQRQRQSAATPGAFDAQAAARTDLERSQDEVAAARARAGEANVAAAEITNRIFGLDGGRHMMFEVRKKEVEAQPGLSTFQRWLAFGLMYQEFNSLKLYFDLKAFLQAAELSPMFAFLLMGLLAGLIYYADFAPGLLGTIGRILVGSAHFAAHLATLIFISWLATAFGNPTGHILKYVFPDAPWPDVARISINFGVTLLAGGLLGGFVMGLYWTVMSALFTKHTDDAFGALGLPHYKNFLRIKLEPDRATVYAIGLDRVPGRNGWRALKPGEVRPSHSPQILPVEPLKPRLIEPPIVIEASKVQP
jgi:hypothetical protein